MESENIDQNKSSKTKQSKLALRDKENKVCTKQNEIVKINKFANISLQKSYENSKIVNNRLKGRTS